jgi:1,4-alpha-glucan branching enzyme
MVKDSDDNGKWLIDLPLTSGTYRYKFIVDDTWVEDPLNFRQEKNSFGGVDSLLHVRPK